MRKGIALTIFAALTTAACFHMRPTTLSELGTSRTRVWVTKPDKSVVMVHDAQVFRGMLVGFVDGKYHELPAEHVQQMHVRRVSPARTLGLVAAGIAGFAAVAVVVSGGLDDVDPCANELCDDP